MTSGVPVELLSALCEVHADSSNAQQRFHGQRMVEDFKARSPPSLLLSTSTALFNPSSLPPLPPPLTPSILQHLSLHLLEHLIAHHWTSLPPSDQSSLQSYALHLLSSLASSPSPPPHLLTHKVVSLTSDLALRSWPQHWPHLLPSLASLPSLHPTSGPLLLCLLVQHLAEEVTRVGAVAEQRRKDVQAGLLLSLDTVWPLLLSSLQSADPRVVVAALDAVRTMVEWVPGQWLYDSDLVPRLLALLAPSAPPNSFLPTMAALADLTGRKSGGLDGRQRLRSVWEAVLGAVQGLLAAPTFHHQHSYLTRTLVVLSHLTRTHSALLTSPEADPSSTQPPLLQRFLGVLGALLAHPHPSISLEALELWVYVFRHQAAALLPASYRPALVGELFRVCVLKGMKPVVGDIPHTDDELEDSDYTQLFSHFRGTLPALIHHLMEAEADVCFHLALSRYEAILGGGSGGLDHLNAAGYTTTASLRFKELEAMAALLDSMFRALQPTAFAGSRVGETAAALLSLLLRYHTDDPLLQTRRLQALSLFTSVFLNQPSTLPPTLSALLSSATFRSAREQSTPLSDLSEDTKACRRRAVHSLTHIARKCGPLLLPHLDTALHTIHALTAAAQLLPQERTLLLEFLVTVSATLPERAAQEGFVRRMVGPQVDWWMGEATQMALGGGEGWVQMLGGGADEVGAVRGVGDAGGDEAEVRRRVKAAVAGTEGARMRAEVLGALSAFAAVFKGVVRGGEEGGVGKGGQVGMEGQGRAAGEVAHPSLPLLFALLPSFCRLLSSIYALHSPSSAPSLPPTLHGVVAASPEHLRLLRTHSPSSTPLPDYAHAMQLHAFLEEATDSLLLLLSIATLAGPGLYAHWDLPLWQATLLTHVPYLPPRLLRYLLERVVGGMMLECEPGLLDGGVMTFVGLLCEAVVGRLEVAWGEVMRRQERSGGGAEAVEIWEEAEVRECTRGLADAFSRVVNRFDLSADRTQRASKDASNHVSLAECAFFARLFADVHRACQFLSVLRFLLLAPDSQSQSKAARIALRLVPLACARTELQPFLAQLLSSSLTLLSRIEYSPTAMTTLDTDLVALSTAVYQQAGKRSEEVRAVVRRWVEGGGQKGEDELRELESRLWGQVMSEKKYRALFRAWLAGWVLGREGGVKALKVEQLSDTWDRDVARKQREHDERGAQVEGGELPLLFDAHS